MAASPNSCHRKRRPSHMQGRSQGEQRDRQAFVDLGDLPNSLSEKGEVVWVSRVWSYDVSWISSVLEVLDRYPILPGNRSNRQRHQGPRRVVLYSDRTAM
jgi:hypothetical protein